MSVWSSNKSAILSEEDDNASCEAPRYPNPSILHDLGANPPTRNSQALNVVVIEHRTFARDCMVQAISSLSEYRVSCYDSVEHWHAAVDEKASSGIVLLSLVGRQGDDSATADLSKVNGRDGFRTVVVGDEEGPAHIATTLQQGAQGYVPTTLSLVETVRAVRFVADGGTFVPASAFLQSCEGLVCGNDEFGPNSSEIFTPRQAAVVRALCRGKPNKIIAYELNMCESTVKVHVRNVMKKLKAKNRTEVAILAQKLRNLTASGSKPAIGHLTA